MDYLEGGTLYDKTNVKYKFHIEESRKIIRGLIKGLAYMHRKSNLFPTLSQIIYPII
jgi:serine/threonine protein kinase